MGASDSVCSEIIFGSILGFGVLAFSRWMPLRVESGALLRSMPTSSARSTSRTREGDGAGVDVGVVVTSRNAANGGGGQLGGKRTKDEKGDSASSLRRWSSLKQDHTEVHDLGSVLSPLAAKDGNAQDWWPHEIEIKGKMFGRCASERKQLTPPTSTVVCTPTSLVVPSSEVYANSRIRTPPPVRIFRPRSLGKLTEEDAHRAEQAWKSRKPFVAALIAYLEGMVRSNSSEEVIEDYPPWVETFSLFSAIECTLSLRTFVSRVMKNIDCSPSAYIVALMYIDRLRTGPYQFCFHDGNAKMMFLTSVLLASKFVDDKVYTNYHFGRVAGISNQKMNRLELFMLDLIEFYCGVDLSKFRALEKKILVKALDCCRMLPGSTSSPPPT